MNEMKGPKKSIAGSQHEIDFDAGDDLAGEGVDLEAGTEDIEMSPSSSTSDNSNEESSGVNTPDSVIEDEGRYSPDSSLSEYEVSLLSAESLVPRSGKTILPRQRCEPAYAEREFTSTATVIITAE
jgi:hypothetical protein